MKKFYFCLVYSLFLTIFSATISAQSTREIEGILNRLSPEQRMKIDGFRRNFSSGNRQLNDVFHEDDRDSVVDIIDRKSYDLNERLSKDSDPESEIEKDSLSLLLEFEATLVQDLERINESIDTAREKLSFEEFQNVEVELNYQMFDTQKLLEEVRTLKFQELKSSIREIKKGPEADLLHFGHKLFIGKSDAYFANVMGAIPSNYKIGPGDTLEINLYGVKSLAFSATIARNGILQFPEVGPINVFENGTSFENLKNLIKKKVKSKLGDGVELSIVMGEVRYIKVFLAGEFLKPGLLFLPATSTLTEALFRCGGIGDYGSLRNISIKRNENEIQKFDFYRMLLSGDNPSKLPLHENDVIFIPTIKNQVSVIGQVIRPAIYEMKDAFELADAIMLSGGFGQNAFPGLIEVQRANANGLTSIFNLNYEKDKSFKLKNGDLVNVMEASSVKPAAVILDGLCERPGEYEWVDGMRVSSLLVNKNSLKKEADLNYSIIKRVNSNGEISVLSFSPNKLFSGEVSADHQLFPDDKIIFLSKVSHEDRERSIRPLLLDLRHESNPGIGNLLVRIEGMVHFPSQYPLTKDMTVSDLIAAGGGMLDSAYTMSAEIARVVYDQNNSNSEARIEHIMLPSLLEEKANNFKLKAHDVLHIKSIPSWTKENKVVISGEVKFPGTYLIKKNETLKDVVKRAGGLTANAFPEGAFLTRENLIEREEKQKAKLISQLQTDIASASLSSTSSSSQAKNVGESLIEKLKSSESIGRLVINLEKQLSENDEVKIVMRDGDKLFIPISPHEVSVLGEIQFPTSHLFDESLSINDYIDKSGGFTRNADLKRVFVIKTNGSVFIKGGNDWFSNNDKAKKVQPGDLIVVPINLQKGKWIENLTSSSQVVYQLAVTAAAVNSF